MLSLILFTIYIDDLQNCGVGCFWDSVFAGAIGSADDVVILAPSPAALRIMLRFAFKHGLQLNSSKTQLIRFLGLRQRVVVTEVDSQDESTFLCHPSFVSALQSMGASSCTFGESVFVVNVMFIIIKGP